MWNNFFQINPLQIHIPALHYTSALQFQNNQAEQPSTRLAFKQVQFDGRSYQLVAGKQLAEGQRILASYLSKLVLYSLLGILLSTLMAWLAGRYILKSMRQLMLATAQVNIQQPNQHIDVQSNTLEVQELRQAMNDMLANIQAAYQQLARLWMTGHQLQVGY